LVDALRRDVLTPDLVEYIADPEQGFRMEGELWLPLDVEHPRSDPAAGWQAH